MEEKQEKKKEKKVLRRTKGLALGVCDGLAEYLDVSTIPMRCVFIAFWVVQPIIAWVVYLIIGFGLMGAPDVDSDG